jgi:hypothetical protein
VAIGLAVAVAGLLLTWSYVSTALQPVRQDVVREQIRQIGGDESVVRAATHAVHRDVHDRAVALAIGSGVIAVVALALVFRRVRTVGAKWIFVGVLGAVPVSIVLFLAMNLVDGAAFRRTSF